MKKGVQVLIILIALIPFQLVGVFICADQLSNRQDAWRMVEIVGGLLIVTALMVVLARKLMIKGNVQKMKGTVQKSTNALILNPPNSRKRDEKSNKRLKL